MKRKKKDLYTDEIWSDIVNDEMKTMPDYVQNWMSNRKLAHIQVETILQVVLR